MSEIKNLCNKGFTIPDLDRNYESIAFLTLKIALKSYFSTYQSMSHKGLNFKELEDNEHTSEYMVNYFETIIHFQHFFELIIKDILKEENLLSIIDQNNYKNKSENKEILEKMQNGQDVSNLELEELITTGYKKLLNELCSQIEKGNLNDYSFFKNKNTKETLIQLAYLRNKILHRGSYILKYKDLDIFVGKYILPVVKEIVSLQKYSEFDRFWIYRQKELKIDPLDKIINTCRENQPSIDHIAFLKEIGRAAYHNPHSHGFGLIRSDIANRAKRNAINEIPHGEIEEYLINCPVCSTESLVKYLEYSEEQDECGQVISGWTWVDNIKCYCCSFELQSLGMKNPREYGYALPDFWKIEEL